MTPPVEDAPPAVDGAEALRRARAALRDAAQGLAACHLNACVRCGLCAESCHVYLAEPEPANVPGAKAAKVAAHFRRYHTALGRLAPFLVGARSLTSEALDELVDAVFARCTGCGRCGLHCAVGADIGSIIRAARAVLAAAGKTPPSLQAVVANQLATGNQMAITPDEMRQTAAWIEADLKAEMGDTTISLPVDAPGRRILYVINPREVKFFPLSLMAAAGVFHAAGESWTLSSRFADVTNYGFFTCDRDDAARITLQVVQEAERLGVQEIVLSECGHGFRAFRWEGPNWLGRPYAMPVRSVLELLSDYVESGRIRLDPRRNPDRVTLHDPCNLVRWGGLSEPQRRILRQACADLVEMTPNREQNFCCGGGGGMLATSEYGERRTTSGRIKAEQIRTTRARIVATPCHNCADQLLELNKRYKLGVQVMAVVELTYNALVR